MRIIIAVLVLNSVFLVPARAEKRVAKLYLLGEVTGKPLFVQDIEVSKLPNGHQRSVSTIKDEKGEVVMTEEAEMDGAEILSQKVEQRQIGEAYELKRETGKITFVTYKLVNGKQTKDSEKTETAEKNFITGPVSMPFLAKNWADLSAGKTLPVQFGVFELERSVGFEFSQSKASEKSIEVDLRPANTFVKMLVSPIFMSVDPVTKSLMRYRGRTPLKRKVFGNWKNFDAEILYETVSSK